MIFIAILTAVLFTTFGAEVVRGIIEGEKELSVKGIIFLILGITGMILLVTK